MLEAFLNHEPEPSGYENLGDLELNVGDEGFHSEGVFVRVDEKPVDETIILEVLLALDKDFVNDIAFTNKFNCEFGQWSQAYHYALVGEEVFTQTALNSAVFSELLKRGYLKSGMFRCRHFYMTRHNEIQMQLKEFEKI